MPTPTPSSQRPRRSHGSSDTTPYRRPVGLFRAAKRVHEGRPSHDRFSGLRIRWNARAGVPLDSASSVPDRTKISGHEPAHFVVFRPSRCPAHLHAHRVGSRLEPRVRERHAGLTNRAQWRNGRRGLPKLDESAENSALSQSDGVETAGVIDEITDPWLREVIQNWGLLSPGVRQAIAMMTSAASIST